MATVGDAYELSKSGQSVVSIQEEISVSCLRKSRSAVVAVVLVLAISGCASGSRSASSSTTTSSGGTAIKVGVICSCSGPYGSTFIAAEDVYKSWVNATNAAGGIDGHRVDLVLEDDAATPGTSEADIQTLISDHVAAILDESVVDQVWATTVQQAGIPIVGGNASESSFVTNSDFYPQGTTSDAASYALVATIKAAGARRFGFLYCAEVASCQQSISLFEAAATKLGMKDVYNGEVAATAPNYTAQCLAAEQDHAQALLVGGAPTTNLRIAENCLQQNYEPIYADQGEGIGPVEQDAPGLSKNLYVPYEDIPYWSDTAETTAMNAAIDKYYPGLRNEATEYTQLAAAAWPAGLELAAAVKASGVGASGTVTAADVTRGLDTFKGNTLGGATPPLTFTAGQPHPVDCWFLGRDQGGSWKLLDNAQVTCKNGTASS